jgi:hypothetical protein
MTTIEEAVKSAIETANPGAQVTVDNVKPLDAEGPKAPPVPTISPRVAGNICKLMETAQMQGMQAVAWCEAYQLLQQIALSGGINPNPQGVQFPGL